MSEEDNKNQRFPSPDTQDILKKLDEIEKKVEHIEKMEKSQLKEEETIETDEEKELGTLKEATRKKQFENIADWQKYIWQDCKYKKEVKESDEVDFFCEKRKGPCQFEDCPLNWEE